MNGSGLNFGLSGNCQRIIFIFLFKNFRPKLEHFELKTLRKCGGKTKISSIRSAIGKLQLLTHDIGDHCHNSESDFTLFALVLQMKSFRLFNDMTS